MVGLLHILTVKESDSASLHAQVLSVVEYPVLHLSILSIPLKVIKSACMNKTRLAKTKYFKPSEYHTPGKETESRVPCGLKLKRGGRGRPLGKWQLGSRSSSKKGCTHASNCIATKRMQYKFIPD
jgi:hypothetical protein